VSQFPRKGLVYSTNAYSAFLLILRAARIFKLGVAELVGAALSRTDGGMCPFGEDFFYRVILSVGSSFAIASPLRMRYSPSALRGLAVQVL
jgi:hypothetical protein